MYCGVHRTPQARTAYGGRFSVTVGLRYGDSLWIDVEDEGGGPAAGGPAGAPDADGSLGKGLAIVEALAGKGNWGIASPAAPADGECAPGRVTWARIPWLDAHRASGSRAQAR